MIIINDSIERAESFKLTIPIDEICCFTTANHIGDFFQSQKK